MSSHVTLDIELVQQTTTSSPPPSPSKAKAKAKAKDKHRVRWNGGSRLIVWITFLLGLGLFLFQVNELFKVKNFMEKSTDRVAPLYTVLGVLINIAMGAAFGWPYTVALFSVVSFLGSVWLSYYFPALCVWSERTLLPLTPIVVFVQFMWIG